MILIFRLAYPTILSEACSSVPQNLLCSGQTLSTELTAFSAKLEGGGQNKVTPKVLDKTSRCDLGLSTTLMISTCIHVLILASTPRLQYY